MKIFLSALEKTRMHGKLEQRDSQGNSETLAHFLVRSGVKMHWNLMSYYYIKTGLDEAEYIRDNSELVLIDSGAHSFQKGAKVDWLSYTEKYAQFIEGFDRPNVVGYFEMDVDNVIGYEKVLELREILESVSDKIIPVWHKNRGIADYKKMCQDHAGKVVAITGFKNEDIRDEQYLSFLKYAKGYECKVHCLGMTRTKVLDKVPFDYVDSSSWKQNAVYGRVAHRGEMRKVTRETSDSYRGHMHAENYKNAMKMQEHYYRKWRSVSKD